MFGVKIIFMLSLKPLEEVSDYIIYYTNIYKLSK